MRHLQGCCIARPMDTRVECAKDLSTKQEGSKSLVNTRLRACSVGCTCIAGYGTASQLSRFEVGHSCDFHRWKIMRSLLRRCGDWSSLLLLTGGEERRVHLAPAFLSLEWMGNGETTPTRIRASVMHSGSAMSKCIRGSPPMPHRRLMNM
jgi:hypothetical protein